MRRGFSPRVLAAIVALLVGLTAVGCTGGADGGADIEQAVRAYTEALVPALAAESLDPLRATATPEQVDRVRLYVVEQTQESKVRVLARPVSMDVTETTIDGDAATVKTREEWTYIERDSESGKDVSRKNYEGEVVYRLVRDPASGTWLVSDVESRLKP